jgi:hypothetical protein
VILSPRRNWEMTGYDLSSTGVAQPDAMFGDYWPVAAQPASAMALTIVSDAVEDIGLQVVIRGINDVGEIEEETIATDSADGTIPVDGLVSFQHILNVTKAGSWVGTLTLSAIDATELLVLTPTQYGKQFQVLEFIEAPGNAVNYTYSFSRTPRTLIRDNDLPDIPFPYSEILVYDTLLDLTGYNSELGEKHQRLWKDRFDVLMKQLMESQDEVVAGAQPRFVRDMDGQAGHAARFISS